MRCMTWVGSIGGICNIALSKTPSPPAAQPGVSVWESGLLVERMVKLIGLESKGGYQHALNFSDRAMAVFDFAPFVDANTP